jgi:selenocysteine-specific elongation factor
MKYVIVGTAGHIDHGKSALVRALTGTDPDRLEEEKRRGITIDLGFAHLDLGSDVRVGFIDVPGHERFVKNMLAGVAGIDLVLLVIAADESIKPQTREHFDICRLIGVRRGIVVITKGDLADSEIVDLVKIEAQELLAGSFLEHAPMIAVSARTGEGLPELVAALTHLANEVSLKPAALPFRLPIDRAFVIRGFGAVVTGTLIAGRIEKDSEVELYPTGRRLRVRGIEVYNQPSDFALAGQRTAVNLAGVEARELARGMALGPPSTFKSTAQIDGVVWLLSSARPLKNRAQVHFHCWTAESTAELILLDRKELKPGASAYAQLRLSDPALVLPGDHFILRQFSPVITIGGGLVLDSLAPRHRLADPAVPEFLHVLEQGNPETTLLAFIAQAGESPLNSIISRTGWLADEALRVGRSLEAKKQIVILGTPPLFVATPRFEALERKVLAEIDQFHRANPLIPALAREELRARAGIRLRGRLDVPSAVLFSAVLQKLAAHNQVTLDGEMVRRRGREVQLSRDELAAKDQINGAFEKAGLAVPGSKEVVGALHIDRARAEKILHLLLKEKVLVRVTEDLIFHRAALESLRALVAKRKAVSNEIDVAAFKELTGLSRKYAIPLLEYLDRERVTRRQGETRLIL